MTERFVDRETAEYEERRRQRALRRADRAVQQREREKRIHRYILFTGGGIAAVLIAVIALFTVHLVREYTSDAVKDTSKITADSSRHGNQCKTVARLCRIDGFAGDDGAYRGRT